MARMIILEQGYDGGKIKPDVFWSNLKDIIKNTIKEKQSIVDEVFACSVPSCDPDCGNTIDDCYDGLVEYLEVNKDLIFNENDKYVGLSHSGSCDVKLAVLRAFIRIIVRKIHALNSDLNITTG
jgi:hypothetical protein